MTPAEMRALFLLDPQVAFLNHGSFGACPAPVFAAYQNWQRELERQPVEFLGRRAAPLLAEARAQLAAYVGAAANDVVFFPNPTTAMNMVVRSLELQSGDEILTTDHEYGALDRTWRFVCAQNGAHYINRPVALPVGSHAACADDFFAGVTARTRVIFISHISSPTALVFPVAEICRRARERGILSIVDGAHAPGHVALNLEQLGADIYTGACHKWMCAPKGAAFLYARPALQAQLDPLVVSWGYGAEHPGVSQYIDYHEWQGTRDLAAFLTVPDAIRFQQAHNWAAVSAECRKLAHKTLAQINALTGLAPLCADSVQWLGQMVAARLPAVDIKRLQARLYGRHKVEVPLVSWNGQAFIRVSVQAYNTTGDIERLLQALRTELAES